MPCCCLKRVTSCAKSDVVLSTLISYPLFLLATRSLCITKLLAGNISLLSLATYNYYKEVYAFGCDIGVASVFTKRRYQYERCSMSDSSVINDSQSPRDSAASTTVGDEGVLSTRPWVRFYEEG